MGTCETIKAKQTADVQERVKYVELDATSPSWPVDDQVYDVVLMSYISGSVPESIIAALYKNAHKALQPVTVNADGLGLCPAGVISRMAESGFDAAKCESLEMIHGMTKLVVAHKD